MYVNTWQNKYQKKRCKLVLGGSPNLNVMRKTKGGNCMEQKEGSGKL